MFLTLFERKQRVLPSRFHRFIVACVSNLYHLARTCLLELDESWIWHSKVKLAVIFSNIMWDHLAACLMQRIHAAIQLRFLRTGSSINLYRLQTKLNMSNMQFVGFV